MGLFSFGRKEPADTSWLLGNEELLAASEEQEIPQIFEGFSHAMIKLYDGIEDVTEKMAMTQLDGLRNNIYWILGHVIYYNETRLLTEVEQSEQIKGWDIYFAPGTSPDDFDEHIPSFEALKEEITHQRKRMKAICSKDHHHLTNIEAVTYHMTMHIGQMKTMKLLFTNE